MVKTSQGTILRDLIYNTNSKTFAEIGVWKGHTTRYLLREEKVNEKLKEYWAIDQWAILGESHLQMAMLTQKDWDKFNWRLCLDI